MTSEFNDTHRVLTKISSVALLLYPGLGLALSEYKHEQWLSYNFTSAALTSDYYARVSHALSFLEFANPEENYLTLP